MAAFDVNTWSSTYAGEYITPNSCSTRKHKSIIHHHQRVLDYLCAPRKELSSCTTGSIGDLDARNLSRNLDGSPEVLTGEEGDLLEKC